MAQTVRLLDHQARFLQSPFVFPDKRFFMLCAGYGSGKTRSLVFCVLHIVHLLLGKKDTGGTNPKILVGSKNITFLAKTWTNDFEAFLRSTGSEYSFDRAKNIITIGNVQIILIALEEPGAIYGYSVFCSLLDEVDELPTSVCMEAIKSVNDRVRQHIEGLRDPFIMMTSTSQGLKGLYQTYLHFKDNGIGFVLMRARTQDNFYNGEDYIKTMYSMYKGKERECLLEGQFVSVDSGLVFPDYDPKENDLSVDLYDCIADFSTVYIGQDFNCIEGNVTIYTGRGNVPMKNVRVGDYVLTRDGYRKVLHKECKGVRMVQEFNAKMWATKDHVAITPQGDVELCNAREFYCLPKQSTVSSRKQLALLEECMCTSRLCSEKSRTRGTGTTTILSMPSMGSSIGQFIRHLTEQFLSDTKSTIKTALMITDLRALRQCLLASTTGGIRKRRADVILTNAMRNLCSTMNLWKAKGCTGTCQRLHGKGASTIASLFALTAVLKLGQESELLCGALNAGEFIGSMQKESLTSLLKDTAVFVEFLLQEQARLNTARSIKVIGNDRDSPTRKERKAKVYDIEVEGCHEFFAEGILVHNCGFNAAVAAVVYKGAVVVIKDYDIPDIRKAPQIFRYDFPTQKIVWVPDATYKEHYSEFKKELRQYDITIAYRKANPLVQDRVFAVNRLLSCGRFFVCPMAQRVKHSFVTHQRDPKTNAPTKGGKGAPDHISDCIGYVTHYVLCWHKDMKNLYRFTLGTLYGKRKAQGADAAELEVPTMLLQADRIRLKEADNVVDTDAPSMG